SRPAPLAAHFILSGAARGGMADSWAKTLTARWPAPCRNDGLEMGQPWRPPPSIDNVSRRLDVHGRRETSLAANEPRAVPAAPARPDGARPQPANLDGPYSAVRPARPAADRAPLWRPR